MIVFMCVSEFLSVCAFVSPYLCVYGMWMCAWVCEYCMWACVPAGCWSLGPQSPVYWSHSCSVGKWACCRSRPGPLHTPWPYRFSCCLLVHCLTHTHAHMDTKVSTSTDTHTHTDTCMFSCSLYELIIDLQCKWEIAKTTSDTNGQKHTHTHTVG